MSDAEAPVVADPEEDAAEAADDDFEGDQPEDPEGWNAAEEPATVEHPDAAEQEGDDDDWPDEEVSS